VEGLITAALDSDRSLACGLTGQRVNRNDLAPHLAALANSIEKAGGPEKVQAIPGEQLGSVITVEVRDAEGSAIETIDVKSTHDEKYLLLWPLTMGDGDPASSVSP
jgi:hypothetical protein